MFQPPHNEGPRLNGFEFAAAGAVERGTLPVSGFPRLGDELASGEGEVRYEILGTRDDLGRPSLRVRARARLQLRCRRCLEPMPVEVEADTLLVLAATQAEIDADPADVEAPDRVLASRQMPVRDLVEDELILALPLAPRHEACAADGTDGEKATSPFAGLRGLLRSRH